MKKLIGLSLLLLAILASLPIGQSEASYIGSGSGVNCAAGTSGQVYTTNGSTCQFTTVSGSGTVTGPVSSTAHALATWHDTGGVTLDDNPGFTIASGVATISGTMVAGANGAVTLRDNSGTGNILIQPSTRANNGGSIQFKEPASSGHYNFLMGNEIISNDTWGLSPSTAVDGATFSQALISAAATGTVSLGSTSLSSQVTMKGARTVYQHATTTAEYPVHNNSGTGSVAYSGGTDGNNGGNFVAYGASHATKPNYLEFRQNGTIVGGVSGSGLFNITGAMVTSGTASVNSTTANTTLGDGALIVSGGASISGAMTSSGAIVAKHNGSFGCHIEPKETDIGNTGSSQSIDLSTANVWTGTLTANSTFTFSKPIPACPYVFILTQDSTGSRTLTTAGVTVIWGNTGSKTLSTAVGSVDKISCVYNGVLAKLMCDLGVAYQ